MKDRTYCLTCKDLTDHLPIFLADPDKQPPHSWVRCGGLCLKCKHTIRPAAPEEAGLPTLLQRAEHIAIFIVEPDNTYAAMTKRCPRCKEDKALTAFYLRGSGKGAGRPYGYCKECYRDRYYDSRI